MDRTVAIAKGSGVTFNPGGQEAFWRDTQNRMLFLEGGWGSGKTYVGARKLIDLHVFNAFDSLGRPTFVAGAIVGPTKTGISDYMLPAIHEACGEVGLSYDYRMQLRHNGVVYRDVLVFPDLSTKQGLSVIYVRTAERPDLITGWEVGHAWGDEPTRWKESEENPRDDPYIQLTGRVRDPKANKQALLFTYTNEGDATRIYKEAHSGRDGYAAYRARTKDNPEVREFYETQMRNLTPELAAQYLEGGAMKLTGANVYSSFDAGASLTDRAELDTNSPVVLALDFNITPGMVGLVGQRVPQTGEFIVEREIFDRGLTLEGLLDRFHAGTFTRGFPEVLIYGDASGNSRWAGTGESMYQLIRMKLESLGVPFVLRVKVKNPPVIDRVNAVNLALRGLDNKTRVRIHRKNCPRLVRDLATLRRDRRGEVDKSNPELSHAGDALGYWIEYEAPVKVRTQTTSGRFAFGTG